MSGLARVAAIGPRVTLNGKEYQVRGKNNRFYAEVKAEILKARGNPLELIVEAGVRSKIANDPELLDRVADVVAQKFRTQWALVSYRDYMDFTMSSEGDILTAYHCLRQDDPSITLDDVREYIMDIKFRGIDYPAAREELKNLFSAIAEASGESEGNLNGQTPKPATTGT